MSRPPAPYGAERPPSGEGRSRSSGSERGGWPVPHEDDGWGPSTAVYSAAAGAKPAQPGTNPRLGRAFYPSRAPRPQPGPQPGPGAPGGREAWSPAGPLPGRDQREVRSAERRAEQAVMAARTRGPERGLVWWAALTVLIAIAALGGVIDTLGSIQVSGGFNFGIVIASIVAILVVKRSHMFPIVIAPPIVYSLAAIFQLYVRSSGLDNKRVVLDAAANYLVYGFPAIAAASAAVLIIAGVRLITRK